MAQIYVYAPDETECANIGLVGALLARDAVFELRAGEFGELSFTHPVDPWGKWRALRDGAVLKTMVPVRLVPEVDDGAYVGAVDVYRVARTATKYQRYIYYASTAANDPKKEVIRNKRKYQKTKHKKLLKRGTTVAVIADPRPGDDSYRYKVRVGSGKKRVTGYMEKAGLTLTQRAKPVPQTHDGLEGDAPSYAIQQQLFRVYEVETEANGSDPGSVTVRARRLVYDLLGNICTYQATKNVSCQQVCRGILSRTAFSHPFSVFSDIGDRHVGIDVRDMNPIAALIDPEEGVVAHWGGEVVCDDYDIYLLRRAGMDRGVTIRYGKDLAGVSCRLDSSNVATAIRPVGETASGAPLYLDGHVVNGRHGYNYNSTSRTCANWLPSGYRWALDDDGTRVTTAIERDQEWDGYAIPKAISLPVGDAKVTKKTKNTDDSETSVLTTALARVMLAEAAVEALQGGCDVPEISMEVDFTQLGDTAEYAQYRHLEPLFIYDTVTISHPRVAVKARVDLTSLTWDVAAERVTGANFGALGDAVASIPGWQISGISGGKISPGSVNSGQIAADAIATEHLQAESVNTDALQARAVTAEKIAAGSVEAEHISAGAITAEKLEANAVSTKLLAAFNAVIQQLDAGHATVDTLDAAIATLSVLEAGSATFDRATVTHLVAEALNLEFGTGGDVFIRNLSVAYAQMVNAAIGNLCLKGSDGNYYAIDVNANGTVTATPATVTEEEIAAGETEGGRAILETDITAAQMNTSTLLATYALVNRIDAARIDVDQLFARQAFVDKLNTNVIEGDGFIELSARVQAEEAATAALDNLVRVDTEGLHVMGCREDAEGSRELTGGEVLVDSEGMSVKIGGSQYSRFAARYAQFGDYQIRRAYDNGLLFRLWTPVNDSDSTEDEEASG